MRTLTHHPLRSPTLPFLRLALTVLLALGLWGAPPPPAARAEEDPILVTRGDDAPLIPLPGSLRWAIESAVDGDTIRFHPDLFPGTVTIMAPLQIIKNLTIDGSGPWGLATLDGAAMFRILDVADNVEVVLTDLRLARGNSIDPDRGGAITNHGVLTLRRTLLENNTTTGHGGAIYNTGELYILDSTLWGNRAFACGAVANVGTGQMTAVNATFYGNEVVNRGGALCNVFPPSTMTLIHTTLAENNTTTVVPFTGTAIWNEGTLHMTNSVIDVPDSSVLPDPSLPAYAGVGSVVATNVGNHVEDGSLPGAMQTGYTGLGLLGDNGGLIPTVLPLMPDILVNQVECLSDEEAGHDQRGVARPQGDRCDIGAVEARVAEVITGEATDVTASSATLHGTAAAVDERSASVHLEYRRYGTEGWIEVAEQMLWVGQSADLQALIDGLDPATTYEYRMVGENPEIGTVYGETLTFTTLAIVPTVVTGEATDVTARTATLQGTANARFADAQVWFAYRLGEGTVQTVPADPATVTGGADVSMHAAISGLQPNSVYHYRVIAENGAGEAQGEEATFRTAAVVPTVVTGEATNVTWQSARLAGEVTAHSDETTVWIEYWRDGSSDTRTVDVPDFVTGSDPVTVTADVTELIPRSTYHYRVLAENSVGAAAGEVETFVTAGSAPVASTESAEAVTATGATLKGRVNPRNEDTTVWFCYGETHGEASACGTRVDPEVGTLSGVSNVVVRAPITGLKPNTAYYYRVSAENGTGVTQGSTRSFTTPAVVPTVATGAAADVTGTTATLQATVNAHNADTEVWFEYGPEGAARQTVPASPQVVTGQGDAQVTAALAGLAPMTSYRYRVVARNAAGTVQGEERTFTSAEVPGSVQHTAFVPLVGK